MLILCVGQSQCQKMYNSQMYNHKDHFETSQKQGEARPVPPGAAVMLVNLNT